MQLGNKDRFVNIILFNCSKPIVKALKYIVSIEANLTELIIWYLWR